MLFFVISFAYFTIASCQPVAFQTLFPEQNKLYSYVIRANVTTGTISPINDGSYWTLDGQLSVQVYDDFSRARLKLDDLKTLVHGNNGNSTHQEAEAVKSLTTPWEINVCFSSIYVPAEPVWVTNMKRALSYNLLLAEPRGAPTSSEEPCLHGNCIVIYSRVGNKTKKYTSLVDTKRTRLSSYEQKCLPNRAPDAWYRPSYSEDLSYVMTSERLYEVDEKAGLQTLELRGEFQYRAHDHILSVLTELSLTHPTSLPAESISKLDLVESTLQYVSHNHSNPSNGIRDVSQEQLKADTLQLLVKISRYSIDADNIVRNATLIHSYDFIELLTKLSQLNYTSLAKLFEDVLGTSYELETSRNIYLEILPYVRNEASAKLIRHLIIEQKNKIEDAVLISLIRKLPSNLVDFSRPLLEELEVFTKLGPDYSQDIRHAGILSFATLVHKTMEVSFDQQYFDEIYDKYLRMFNNCPQYLDRLVWLQGLTNIGKGVVHYLDEIHTDVNKDRHERLWAALASLSIWKSSTLENTLPILMNETENIQLRIVALHAFLSSPIGARDFLNVHNYVKTSNNEQLKRFWYTTVKSLESNRFYHRYKSASYYIPFVAPQVSNPDVKYWATNNYIISQEPTLDNQGPTLQLVTVGETWSGPPQLAIVEFATGGDSSFNTAIYIIAEGVTSNVYKRFQTVSELGAEKLLQELKKMKVEIVENEKVHIDIVVKVNDKTVYATHVDQTTFDSWNSKELKKSIEDFVRFGSHINQQIVNYPAQVVKDFPTEIGTPVRLHSTIVSFTSLRGNLTAPSTEDFMSWRNDLHIRYQGTSVTSLSTDGPMHPSKHSTRLQQSLVVHLPIKFDISVAPVDKSMELKWTNPSQNGGIAMHSRAQIYIESKAGHHSHTVSTNAKQKEKGGIYFDCENPKTETEISQLLTSRSYNILTTLQPSQLILNSIRMITSPPSGSCGLILPPHQLEAGNILQLEVKFQDPTTERHGDSYLSETKAKISYSLRYYRELEGESPHTYVVLKGYSDVHTDGQNGGLRMELNALQPQAVHKNWMNWTICLEEQHKIDPAAFDIDFTSNPAMLEGKISFNVSNSDEFSCFSSEPSSALVVDFKSYPKEKGVEKQRHLKVRARGKNLPNINLDSSSSLAESQLVRLINSFGNPPVSQYFSYAESKAFYKDPDGTEPVNKSKETELDSDIFSWLPKTLTAVQILTKLGFYHECRIRKSEVKTFSGAVKRLPSWYNKVLAAGDCSDTPRFAVMLKNNDSGIILYSGDEYIAYSWIFGQNPQMSARRSMNTRDFRVTTRTHDQTLRSTYTGVLVYHKPWSETVILIPHAYMATVCGACAGNVYYDTE